MTIKDYFNSPRRGVVETSAAQTRVFFFSARGWRVIENQLSKTFGSGAAVMMLEMGTGYGKGVAQEVLKVSKGPDAVLAFVVDLAAAAGWGNMEVEKGAAKLPKFWVTVRECAMCSSGGTSDAAACYFLAGVTLGVAQEAFGAHYRVQEEKCARKGDEYCRFVLERM